MSILDTKYKFIDLDLVLETTNKSIYFSLSDKETSDFYVKLTKFYEFRGYNKALTNAEVQTILEEMGYTGNTVV